MKKALSKRILVFFMLFFCVVVSRSTYVEASMASEAQKYTLGETYRGAVNEDSDSYTDYYKFTIKQKSHVSLSAASANYKGEFWFALFNSQGKSVLSNSNIKWKKNNATGVYKGSGYRTLEKGTYYLGIHDEYGCEYTYSFKIRAEKLITLSKGSFSSLKSNKAGQMTVVCKAAKKALGYRIQYSTDYRFRSGVKTVYATSKTKTIKGLKRGKKYYVKVCPFNVYNDGEYVFGTNSGIKAVTIKKK